MQALAFLIISLSFLPQLLAGTSAAKCFDACSNDILLTDKVISDYSSLGSKMPQIKYNSKGTPADLIWVPVPEKAFAEVDEIGRYMDRSIYRVRYSKPVDNPDPNDPKSELICAMLALEGPRTSKDAAPALSPFFVDTEEDPSCIRHFDSPFISSKEHPFALCIEKAMKGTGLYSYTWTFLFMSDGARISERSTFGRLEGAKTYQYDKSGRVVSAQTSENN